VEINTVLATLVSPAGIERPSVVERDPFVSIVRISKSHAFMLMANATVSRSEIPSHTFYSVRVVLMIDQGIWQYGRKTRGV